jgi:hypothetical protein
LEALFMLHSGKRADFKASRFINGKGGWRGIDGAERKAFLKRVCELAVENGGKCFGIDLSFAGFDVAAARDYGQPFNTSYCPLYSRRAWFRRRCKGSRTARVSQSSSWMTTRSRCPSSSIALIARAAFIDIDDLHCHASPFGPLDLFSAHCAKRSVQPATTRIRSAQPAPPHGSDRIIQVL